MPSIDMRRMRGQKPLANSVGPREIAPLLPSESLGKLRRGAERRAGPRQPRFHQCARFAAPAADITENPSGGSPRLAR